MKKKINYKNLILKRRKEKLNNVLRKVEELAKDKNSNRCAKTIFYIVKIYADSINYKNNVNLLCGCDTYDINNDTYLIKSVNPISNVDVNLQLGKVPVVTWVREQKKQIDTLRDIGNKDNLWKEDKERHWYNLYLPLGLVVTTNDGNHSVNCGIVKSVGMINISSNKDTTNIYDNSDIYNRVFFDGKYYRDIRTNKILARTKFECGCLFEIGRIIKKYEIFFLDIFKEDIQKSNTESKETSLLIEFTKDERKLIDKYAATLSMTPENAIKSVAFKEIEKLIV